MAAEKTTKKEVTEEKVEQNDVMTPTTEPVEVVETRTEGRSGTNRMATMWAFVAVAGFVGLVGGFFCGFVSGRLSTLSHDTTMQGPGMYDRSHIDRQPYWGDNSYGL